jgi:hypothetical protein
MARKEQDMTTLREAAQQALEALEFMADEWGFTQKSNRPERWQAIDALRAALEQPYAEQARRVEQETHGRMRIDPVTGDVSIGTPTKQEQEPAAFDALVAISLLTHLGGEVADYEDVVEAVRRLHALNGELLEVAKLALRMGVYGGVSPSTVEDAARAAIAKAEGKV